MKELKYKEEMMTFMEEEYEKTPKDVNRNQYLKRINEINGQVKSQQTTIALTLEDVNKVQDETEDVIKQIAQVDREVEGLLFEVAKKDKHSRSVYEKFVALKEVFGILIENVQQQTMAKNHIQEAEDKIETFKDRYKDFQETATIESDFQKMVAQNQKIQAKLSQL